VAIKFTSDQHFGHANIIKHCGRPFENVYEMDCFMIERWNNSVATNDHVYIIGDLMFRAQKSPEHYLDQLKGKKHLIVGNHDKYWMKKCDLGKYFLSVDTLLEIGDGKNNIVLCHYPMMSWNKMMHGTYHIFGHIHNGTNAAYWPLLCSMPNALNAGVDVNGFSPCTLEELIANREEFLSATATTG
jgi:calcineurin-like phosphoesterase family protein